MQHLARLLALRGHAVKALVRKTSLRQALEASGATFAEGDIVSGHGLAEGALRDVDVVIHLAGSPRRNEQEYHAATPVGQAPVTSRKP